MPGACSTRVAGPVQAAGSGGCALTRAPLGFAPPYPLPRCNEKHENSPGHLTFLLVTFFLAASFVFHFVPTELASYTCGASAQRPRAHAGRAGPSHQPGLTAFSLPRLFFSSFPLPPALVVLLTPVAERWLPARRACAAAAPYVDGTLGRFVRLTDRLFRHLPDRLVHGAWRLCGGDPGRCARRPPPRLTRLLSTIPPLLSGPLGRVPRGRARDPRRPRLELSGPARRRRAAPPPRHAASQGAKGRATARPARAEVTGAPTAATIAMLAMLATLASRALPALPSHTRCRLLCARQPLKSSARGQHWSRAMRRARTRRPRRPPASRQTARTRTGLCTFRTPTFRGSCSPARLWAHHVEGAPQLQRSGPGRCAPRAQPPPPLQ